MTKATKPKKAHVLDPAHPLVALVIAKLKNSKAQRETVEPGLYDVDVTLRITAEVSVGVDHPAEQVNKIEPWTIITLLLDKLPAVKIEEVVAEASAILTLKEDESELEDRAELMKERALTVLDIVKPAAADAVDAIKSATIVMKKGAVKLENVAVEVIEEHTDATDEE